MQVCQSIGHIQGCLDHSKWGQLHMHVVQHIRQAARHQLHHKEGVGGLWQQQVVASMYHDVLSRGRVVHVQAAFH